MYVKSYNELVVWQKSMDLSVDIYKLSKYIPAEEKYGLISQMRRAVISIPSNIAEGHTRKSTKEFIQFLYIAKASNAELETQIEITFKLGFLEEKQFKNIYKQCNEISKMLRSLISSLDKAN